MKKKKLNLPNVPSCINLNPAQLSKLLKWYAKVQPGHIEFIVIAPSYGWECDRIIVQRPLAPEVNCNLTFSKRVFNKAYHEGLTK